MRCLVTGLVGFIGFHLGCRLLGGGHRVIGLNNYCDVTLKVARNTILKGYDGFSVERPSGQDGDVPNTIASPDRLERLTGYKPETPISMGVPAFVGWFHQRYDL